MRFLNSRGNMALNLVVAGLVAVLAIVIYTSFFSSTSDQGKNLKLQGCLNTQDIDGDEKFPDDCPCDHGTSKDFEVFFLFNHKECVVEENLGSDYSKFKYVLKEGDKASSDCKLAFAALHEKYKNLMTEAKCEVSDSEYKFSETCAKFFLQLDSDKDPVRLCPTSEADCLKQAEEKCK